MSAKIGGGEHESNRQLTQVFHHANIQKSVVSFGMRAHLQTAALVRAVEGREKIGTRKTQLFVSVKSDPNRDRTKHQNLFQGDSHISQLAQSEVV